MDLKDKIIEKLCEIAIHVGFAESKPSIVNVIKGLRKAKCKNCDSLADDLQSLRSQLQESPKEYKSCAHPDKYRFTDKDGRLRCADCHKVII